MEHLGDEQSGVLIADETGLILLTVPEVRSVLLAMAEPDEQKRPSG